MTPEIIPVSDQNELVATASFPHAHFPFENFNPIQSRVLDFYDKPANLVVAAATSAGKTIVAELLLSHEINVLGGKGMYIGPLKALTQEKVDDWSDEKHHFSDKKLSICTGDYRLTAARKQELEESDLVIMTPEMLSSRVRNMFSEHNDWLTQISTLCLDEAHSLTIPQRGDRMEVAIMKMMEVNPKCRLVLLSATMPNVKEVAGWIAHLTQRDTYVLESEYRPCPLQIHYKPFDDRPWSYDAKEDEKVKAALSLVMDYPDDKFLLFVHTKRTGELMKVALKRSKIDTEFHNADLDKDKRVALENRFRTDPKFRVIIATSTIAAGVNLPARRVVVLGDRRGLAEIPVYEIQQMVGRAGRPRYDPRGDAYVLLPQSKIGECVMRLQNPEPIVSQLAQPKTGDYRSLAFHIVSEIYQGNISNLKDIHKWYERTFAAFQNKDLHPDLLNKMIESMQKRGIIRDNDGKLEATAVGKVSSMFYFSPFDVADLKRNFGALFEQKQEMSDMWLSLALANIDSYKGGFASNAEREQMQMFQSRITPEMHSVLGGDQGITDPVAKMAFCYNMLLSGTFNAVFAAPFRGLQTDSDRLVEVLVALNNFATKWEMANYLKLMGKRIKDGVPWELLSLCKIKGVGKVKARKLWNANIRNPQDVATKPNLVRMILQCSEPTAKKICLEAAKVD